MTIACEPLELRLALSGVAFVAQPLITHLYSVAEEAYAADLNSDGHLDVLVAEPTAYTAWYQNSNGAGAFGPRQTITQFARGVTSLHTADLDGDGDLDVLYGSRWNDNIVWHENTDGKGLFSGQQVISDDADEARSVDAADLDGDGDLDVVSASAGNDTIAWYPNTDGAGRFGAPRVITTAADGARSVEAADLDGDGDVDIVSASRRDGTIAWYENRDAAGLFGPPNIITSERDEPSALHAADLDNDGDLDVLSASYADDTIAWYENVDARGVFGPPKVISADTCGAKSVDAGDLDGDGDLDVLSASEGRGIAWYENLGGAGGFGPIQMISSEGGGASVMAAELDGDGRLDVVATLIDGYHETGTVLWYRNTGAAPRTRPPGDVNADGRFDRSDLVAVLQAGKYLSAEPATWEEGDWNGDGVFDPRDVAAALQSGSWWPPVDDHGDSPSQATPLDLPAIALGTIETCNDQDWFRFSAAAGVTYVFEVELETLRDSTLQLFGPDGVTQLAFNDDAWYGRASRIEWIAPSSGTFYLCVGPFGHTGAGTYKLLSGRAAAAGSA